MLLNPRVFISYAHSNADHMEWVKKLADALRRRSIAVTLDQDDLHLGQLIDKFQRDGISQADRVLVICTETYVAKCDIDRDSGAGQEKALIQLEVENQSQTIKFIPILRDNPSRVMPFCLNKRLWLDASVDAHFDNTIERLVYEIYRLGSSELPSRS